MPLAIICVSLMSNPDSTESKAPLYFHSCSSFVHILYRYLVQYMVITWKPYLVFTCECELFNEENVNYCF